MGTALTRPAERLRARRAAWAAGGRGVPRVRLARGAGGRGATEGSSMKYFGIAFVYGYRWVIAPLLPAGGSCKFHPSCSQYAIDALKKYGLVRGSAKAAWRLLRCHPWSHGGVDYA